VATISSETSQSGLTQISSEDHTYSCTDNFIVLQQADVKEQESESEEKDLELPCGLRIVELGR
jgi:hypothetical protein